MNIEEFVGSALEQIASSTNDKNMEGHTFMVSPSGIDFDLAVITTNEKDGSSDKSVKGNIKIAGGGFSSSSRTAEKHEIVSRIKFTVHHRSS